jgi:hypothetical protein
MRPATSKTKNSAQVFDRIAEACPWRHSLIYAFCPVGDESKSIGNLEDEVSEELKHLFGPAEDRLEVFRDVR